MAKYTVTHTCGHEEVVNLVGAHSSREWRLKSMEKQECFECIKQAALKEAQKEAQEQELPALHGSDAQVAWAETLRMTKIREIELMQREGDDPSILKAIDAIMMETSAHQWIEWRNISIYRIIEVVQFKQAKMEESPSVSPAPKPSPKAIALGEATLRPETLRTEAIAEIRIEVNIIKVIFPEKREDFRELVKFRLGYEWEESCWQRTINPMWHGTPQDRAIELGRTLLAAGFSVRCFDEDIRAKILSGEFTPECTRWIKKRVKGDYKGWFAIEWGRNEDFYKQARKIKRSIYDRPMVLVSPEQFEQVLDFAQMYNFQLSAGAQEIIEQARATRDAALTVAIEPDPERVTKLPTEMPTKLDVPENVEVLDEFREGA